jgi:hypothetical protein
MTAAAPRPDVQGGPTRILVVCDTRANVETLRRMPDGGRSRPVRGGLVIRPGVRDHGGVLQQRMPT